MNKKKLAAYAPHLGLAVLLVLFAYLAKVLIPVEQSPLPGMGERELRTHLERDLGDIARLDAGLRKIVRELVEGPVRSRTGQDLSSEERRWVRGSWPAFVEASRKLDSLKRKYKGFYQIDYLSKPALHAEAFLAAYSAFVARYRSALYLVQHIGQDALLPALLDRGEENGAIPAGTYFRLKQHLTHPDSLVRLNAGRAYLRPMKDELVNRPVRVQRLERDLDEIDRTLGHYPELFIQNPLERLEKIAFEVWYPER